MDETVRRVRLKARHNRKRGRAFLTEAAKQWGVTSNYAFSNKFLYEWAHANPSCLPPEHAVFLLSCKPKVLPIELGAILTNTYGPDMQPRKRAKANRAPRQIKPKPKPKERQVSTKAFYSSWEWKQARFETLKRYGATCMCCHSTKDIVVDHILPIRTHPELRLSRDNLQILCNSCNMGKGSHDTTDFRPITQGEYLEMDRLPDWLSAPSAFNQSSVN